MASSALVLSGTSCSQQVKGEIIYQARRLDSHPALAIWGGGNEVEASFRWFPDSRDNPQFYTPDYIQVSGDACPFSLLFPPCHTHLHCCCLEGSTATLRRLRRFHPVL